MKIRKWLIGLGVILALIAGLSPLTTLAQASEVRVTLDAPDQVSVGNEFVARLNISHVEGFDAAVLRVRFDPAILSLTDVTAGNIGGTTIPIAATSEIESGLWGITANVPGFPGVTGEGYLMGFHFSALASGNSTLGLEHYSLSNKNAQEITATWVGVGTLTVGLDDAPAPATTDVAATTSTESPTEPTSESSEDIAASTSPEPPSEFAPEQATEPPAPEEEEEEVPEARTEPFNLPLIGGLIGVIMVVGIVIYLVRRRAY